MQVQKAMQTQFNPSTTKAQAVLQTNKERLAPIRGASKAMATNGTESQLGL